MKEVAKTGSKKWLWLLIAVAAVAAIAGALLLLPKETAEPVAIASTSKLYWNVDRDQFTDPDTGLSVREPEADGTYSIRFAVDGQLQEFTITGDKQLVNYIDFMDVMGLNFDADGTVIGVLEVTSIAQEIAKDFYVRKADENSITINTSKAMNGMESVVTLTAQTGIYDVSAEAEVLGQPATCAGLDEVSIYADADGNVTHVFITERAVKANVYWRVDQYYNADASSTTRKPDENGVYTLRFACNGEQVDLKCKDRNLVTTIDSVNLVWAMFAFRLDEEGYIVEDINVATALGGMLGCDNQNIVELNGDYFATERQLVSDSMGSTYSNTLTPDCDIFLVEDGCEASFVGERTDHLKLGDRISCYTDLDGKPILIFVHSRLADSTMYFNAERNPSRQPDSKGYYVYRMAGQGKELTLRTKDEAIARKIDSYGGQMMGLKLNGDLIEKVYDPKCVCGGWAAGQQCYVVAASGSVVSLGASLNLASVSSHVVLDRCEIYDVTGYPGVKYGSKTTLQLNDRVTAYHDISYNLTHVYVTERYVEDAKIYYNKERLYHGVQKETVRVPDADGYYVFDMCCEGKEVKVKTKSKELATFMDKQYAPLVALTVNKNGIVKNAYPAIAAVKYGYKQLNTNYISKVEKDGTVYAHYFDENNVRHDRAGSFKMAKDCKVYNVSTCFLKNRGELTTLQEGDLVQAIATNPNGELTQIFVLNRKLDSPIYWKTEQKYNSSTGETTRVPDADGWYVFDLAVDGQIKQYRTKDKALASAVDKENQAFSMRTNGNEILGVYSIASAKGIKNYTAGNFDVIKLTSTKATVKRNQPNATNFGDSYDITFAKNYKVYDVSPYAKNFGAPATLEEGDRITCLINDEGKVVYVFIVYKNTHKAGYISHCPHCDQDVFWEPFTSWDYGIDVHFYLTHDITRASQLTIGSASATEKHEVVFDLNGHTITAEKRGCLIYSDLVILDTAGGGKVVAKNADGSHGGIAMVLGSGSLTLYSGTLTQTADAPMAQLGGIHVTEQGTIRVLGGTITGGRATMGANIYLTNQGSAVISGGKITNGDIYVSQKQSLTLSGKPEIELVTLQAGATLQVEQLQQGASITVSAEGVFTEANSQMAAYQTYFKPLWQDTQIQLENDALVCVLPKVPSSVDNSNLTFDLGTTNAMCPVCRKKVTWIGISGELTEHQWLQAGGHYYLSGDVTYAGTDEALYSPISGVAKTACLHLNGHNITATAGKAIHVGDGTLNVMGNGIVSGANATTYGGATIHTWGSGKLNLYGGTYTKGASTYPVIFVGACTVQLFEGFKLDGQGVSAAYYPLLYLENNNATVQMYGGMIQNGKSTGTCGNVKVYQGTFSMLGGVIQNGSGSAAGNVHILNTGKLSISGGEIKGGSVYVETDQALTLTEAPKISQLILPAGVKLTLGDLEAGAEILVDTNGVFTTTSDKIETLQNFFKPFRENMEIKVESGALACRAMRSEAEIRNDNLVFEEGTNNAYCAICKKTVQWTAFSGSITAARWVQDGGHYYLSGDLSSTAIDGAITSATTAGNFACLHLNGHNITSTVDCTITTYGTTPGSLNILGNGTVSGGGTVASEVWRAATLNVTHGAVVNLYGGTYTKGASNSPVVWVFNGKVNLYDGAKILGTKQNLSTYSSGVYLQNAEANFHMHGGEITGGTNYNSGGNVCINNGSFVMDGGVISGGVAQNYHGGNVYLKAGSFTMNGGTVSGGTATYFGSNIYVNAGSTALIAGGNITAGNLYVAASGTTTISGAPIISELKLPSGITVKLGSLVSGANVVVNATGAFTEANSNAASFLNYFKAFTSGKTVKEENGQLMIG